MTRPIARRCLLSLALAAALAGPVQAQNQPAFTVSDIRVEGLQRISAGTVFTYLPVEKGDTLDRSSSAEAIRALFQTGFFSDVRLERQGDILVVVVTERPAINTITLTGNKDIKSEDLLGGLRSIGLAEGETFNPLNLDRVTQELIRQYNNRGKYNVSITPSITNLDRNRVDIAIVVEEGKASRISDIRAGQASSNPGEFEVFNDALYFRAFTTGQLSWQTLGGAAVSANFDGVGPTEGAAGLVLASVSPSVGVGSIESALGIVPASLVSGAHPAVEGQSASTTVTVSAGDTLTFSWTFLTKESVGTSYDDFGFVSIHAVITAPCFSA